jgi:hypothetical protein
MVHGTGQLGLIMTTDRDIELLMMLWDQFMKATRTVIISYGEDGPTGATI